MKSIIEAHLKPKLHPVALLRSDVRPDENLQPKMGKYVCIMTMFAQVSAHGKTAVFDRNTYGCPGASAGLGFGSVYPSAMGGLDTFEAFFSKGIYSAKNPEAYQQMIDNAPKHMVNKLTVGEKFHATPEKAHRWMTEELPLYNFKEKYRILKPLSQVSEEETPESIIFVVNPLQLSALITLAGSIHDGLMDIMAPQGAACQMIGAYVFQQAESPQPRPVLGLTDLAARKHVRKTLPQDTLTLSMPWKLYLQYENAAEDGIFSSPLWEDML
ncbi:DUF169 domain-containing protein [Maridesulfovibrio salexigens]|uniref:DUF169 domain-containing protein n=1 Tax=Maridesulfovibrio salexigens (strain ATCC 14822 / DSM 2638 / NCIMB 8403 / VKM B-1763) TaxID=526222 RepID=C6BRK6_MARSD|nr:DUF169 domain-containing protein [Maridesulfovibrio salexigens]ACS79446.1 conserved hypothetical protein [Maridesulfovibrio salexigens DSM 2638]